MVSVSLLMVEGFSVISAEDEPPVAEAGPDVSLTMPENFVTLYGNGSTDDEGIVSYRWTSAPENNQLTWVMNVSSIRAVQWTQ